VGSTRNAEGRRCIAGAALGLFVLFKLDVKMLEYPGFNRRPVNLVRNRADWVQQSQFGNGANLLNHYDTRPFRRYYTFRQDDLKWVNLAFLPFPLRHGNDGHHFKGAVESIVGDDDNGPSDTLLLASDSGLEVSPIGVPPANGAEVCHLAGGRETVGNCGIERVEVRIHVAQKSGIA
jgi:hypothetical protein